jgi:hypothetical protein
MRWENLTADPTGNPARDAALFGADAVITRTFDTPEFRGITFHEIRAKSRRRGRPTPCCCTDRPRAQAARPTTARLAPTDHRFGAAHPPRHTPT